MPDPRLPQRPGSRQPAPQKGTPPSPKASDTPSSSSRLIRPLDPRLAAPPVESERKIRKGETYWIVGCNDISEPRKAKVIRLSNEPGCTVCVEFEEPIGGVDEQGQRWGTTHNCGGLGKMGHCLFVNPEQVVDEKTMQAHKAHAEEHNAYTSPAFDEYEEMSVNPQPAQPGSIEVLNGNEDEDKSLKT